MISSPSEAVVHIDVIWQTVAVVGSISLSIIGALLTGYGWMMKKIINMTLAEITNTLAMVQRKLSEMDERIAKNDEKIEVVNKTTNKTREIVNLVIHTHNKEKKDNISQIDSE